MVLDTNVLLASLATSSPLRWVFDRVLDGRVGLIVSTEIVLEYEEVPARRTRPAIAAHVVRALLSLSQTRRVAPAFRWHLVPADPDDDKFVDAALAGGADALVAEDAHFDAVRSTAFPRVNVWSVNDLNRALHDG